MKQKRQEAILNIIKNEEIETQEILAQRLIEKGFDITQATVSRDIKELRLIKTLSEKGIYKYSVSEQVLETGQDKKYYYNLLTQSIVSLEVIFNQIIVKCYTGTAQAACAGLDAMNMKEIAGTVAGDDTILIITRSNDDAEFIAEEIRKIIR